MKTNFILCLPMVFLTVTLCFQSAHPSEGETLPLFHSCLVKCHMDFCQQPGSYPTSSLVFDWIIQTLWSCDDDCEYNCMWPVIHMRLQEQWRVPQFHGKLAGFRLQPAIIVVTVVASMLINTLFWVLERPDLSNKFIAETMMEGFSMIGLSRTQNCIFLNSGATTWPFIRWFGMQEPASAIFSLFNLVSIMYMFKKFYTNVRNGSVMYWIWIFYTAVSINTWFWSILFHIRDTSFSERMDYIGATTLIYATLGVFGFRILLFRNWSIKLIFIAMCVFYFSQHVKNLITGPLDYYRNFDTLLLIALLTGASTMLWCLWNWRKASHVQFAAIYIILILAVASLEILDFPPILWTFDAHALWHLATVPLQFFIYKFATEDCRYLHRLHLQKTISPVAYQNLSVPSVCIHK